MNHSIRQVDTSDAPKAIGPYSQAVAAGSFLFVSGQIPLDPKTGKLVPATIEAQTRRVLDNIEAILKAEGLHFKDVVKVEVFLKNMSDFSAMNAIYAEKFNHAVKPARQAIEAARLPMDVLIEISCIAFFHERYT